jgi:hypothetical protein
MQNYTTEIALQTNDDSKILRMHDFERFEDGSGYRCSLVIRSGGFSCARPFYFDDSHFPDAITALQQMDAGHPGEAMLKGRWEDDHIRFVRNDLGHVTVTGQLHEHSELPQLLKFGFRTDQTVLRPLVCDLLKLKSG